MKILMKTVAVAAMAFVPATAQAQLFGGLDNGTLLGGTIGAGLGGAIGSNLAGSGLRDEGTAIGAALGGLAGASFANRQSNFAGNPFAGQFNPGFTGRNLLGAGIGAGIGGALGSNLAASGVREEGTAIGAALGGLAGYALSNRGASRYGGVRPVNGFGGGFGPGVVPVGGFNGGGFGPAGPVFLGGPGFGPAGPGLVRGPGLIGGPGFGAPGFGAPGFGAPGLPSAPVLNGPRLVPSGQFVSGPILPVTRFVQPAPRPIVLSQPRTVFTAPQTVTVAAPRPTVTRRTVVVQQAPVVRQERIIVKPATCPAGTTTQADGSCLDRTVTYETPPAMPAPAPAPVVIQPAPVMDQPAPVIVQQAPVVAQPYVAPQMADCPAGTTQQSDGTCMEASFSEVSFNSSTFSGASERYGSTSSAAAPMQMADCPAGTTLQADGSCLSSSVTSYTPSYSTSSSIGSSYSAPATTYVAPAPTYSVPETVVRPQAEYCYSGGSKRYDGLGKEIKADKHDHCRSY